MQFKSDNYFRIINIKKAQVDYKTMWKDLVSQWGFTKLEYEGKPYLKLEDWVIIIHAPDWGYYFPIEGKVIWCDSAWQPKGETSIEYVVNYVLDKVALISNPV